MTKIATGETTPAELNDTNTAAKMSEWRFGPSDKAFVREAFVEAAKLRTEMATADADSTVIDAGYAMPDQEHNPANPNCSCEACRAGAAAEPVIETAADSKPYGDVTYADPGYQDDGVKRYPIDSEAHVRAAWSYINQEKNAGKYSADQVSQIKARIRRAAKKHGVEISDASLVLVEDASVATATTTPCWHDMLATAASGEQRDLDLARSARKSIAALILSEATEQVAGENETWDLLALAQAMQYIDQFISSETYSLIAEEIRASAAVETASDGDVATHVKMTCPACGKKIRLRLHSQRAVVRASEEHPMPETAVLRNPLAETLLTQGTAMLAQMDAIAASFRAALASIPAAVADEDAEAKKKKGLAPVAFATPLSDGQLPTPGATADETPAVAEGTDAVDDTPPATLSDASTASEGEAEAGLTIVLHDSEDGSDPKLGTDGVDDVSGVPGGDGVTDTEIPAHDHPADGSPPPGLTVPHDNLPEHDHPVDGSPPRPKAKAIPPGGPDADPNDPTKKKRTPPPASAYKDEGEHEEQRRATRIRNAAMVAEFTHEQLAQAVQDTIADLPSMRQGPDLRTKAGRDAYIATLMEAQHGQEKLIAMSNLGQVGSAYGMTNPDYVKGRVAVADATVLMAEQDIDLSGLFSH